MSCFLSSVISRRSEVIVFNTILYLILWRVAPTSSCLGEGEWDGRGLGIWKSVHGLDISIFKFFMGACSCISCVMKCIYTSLSSIVNFLATFWNQSSGSEKRISKCPWSSYFRILPGRKKQSRSSCQGREHVASWVKQQGDLLVTRFAHSMQVPLPLIRITIYFFEKKLGDVGLI